jgi:hypothetical protein
LNTITERSRRKEVLKILSRFDETEWCTRIWPNLSLISCWADGFAAKFIPEIRRKCNGIEIQPKGIISTEAMISVPLTGIQGSVLSVGSHFFEFLSIESQQNEKVFLATELELGECYQVVVTTSGGLYRYNTQDVIMVVDFFQDCPVVRFVGRSNLISDLTGEKLNEIHVQNCILKAINTCGLKASFYMLAPKKSGLKLRYVLFLQLLDENAVLKQLSKTLDHELCANIHYKYARNLGQLDSVKIFIIDQDSKPADLYLMEMVKRGKNLGSTKTPSLSSLEYWEEVFRGRFLNADN